MTFSAFTDSLRVRRVAAGACVRVRHYLGTVLLPVLTAMAPYVHKTKREVLVKISQLDDSPQPFERWWVR